VRIGVESFRGEGYERGRSRGLGRNQKGRRETNLGNNYSDARRCYTCNRLGYKSKDCWYKREI